MLLKKFLPLCSILLLLCSCWKYYHPAPIDPVFRSNRVWGYKPIYGTEGAAKSIVYSPAARSVAGPGNIYAYGHYIFQLDPGLGIHVIDNSIPSQAHRIGFINVKGCSQIAIKEDKLYTNSYDDLVVLDFSQLDNVHEFSRLPGVFKEYRYGSPIASPPSSGYYECPRFDSLVVGWKQDSVYMQCYK